MLDDDYYEEMCAKVLELEDRLASTIPQQDLLDKLHQQPGHPHGPPWLCTNPLCRELEDAVRWEKP